MRLELGDLVKVTKSYWVCVWAIHWMKTVPHVVTYKNNSASSQRLQSGFQFYHCIYVYIGCKGVKNLVSAVTLSAPARSTRAFLLELWAPEWPPCSKCYSGNLALLSHSFCLLCLHFGPFLIHDWTSCMMHPSTEQNIATLPVISVCSCYFLLKSLSGEMGRKMLFGDLGYPLGHDSQAQYCSFFSPSQLHIVTEKMKSHCMLQSLGIHSLCGKPAVVHTDTHQLG